MTRDDSLVTLILCVDSQNNNLYYLQDHLNSPIRLLNDDGETPLAYDEFGVPTTDSKPNTNPFGFTGYQLDEITNMHYAQARYYNSTTGRFTAEDPIRDQNNWYGYCNANPNTSIDPTGLFVMPGGGGTWEQTIDDYYPSAQPPPSVYTPINPIDFEMDSGGRPVYVGTTSTTGSGSTGTTTQNNRGNGSAGTTTQNNRNNNNNECTIRSIAPIDFEFQMCSFGGGLGFVRVGTGEVLTPFQNVQVNQSIYDSDSWVSRFYRITAGNIFSITEIDPSWNTTLGNIYTVFNANRDVYENLALLTGLPSELIAAIHYRENATDFLNGTFGVYLHNGDPLGTHSVKVPNPPFFDDFDAAAIHALTNDSYHVGNATNLGLTYNSGDIIAMTTYSVLYNGWPPGSDGVSDYAFNGTNILTGGRFTADGQYDPNASPGANAGTLLVIARLLGKNVFPCYPSRTEDE